MKIFIDQDTIHNYPNNEYSEITQIDWYAGELRKDVLRKFPNLISLCCSNNKITTLEPISECITLENLYCNNNKIESLKPISSCINLQVLYCNNNQIDTLDPISNCIKIRELWCSNNKIGTINIVSKYIDLQRLNCSENNISTLDPIYYCKNLTYLSCAHNKISSIDVLSSCIQLQILWCKSNFIKSLDPLSKCINLQELTCDNNLITSLSPISSCINLRELYCYNNQITSLEPLIYLRRLLRVIYYNNPLQPFTPQIRRYLDQIYIGSCDINKTSIYKDNQNVHDSFIQKSVCESVQNILRDPKPNFHVSELSQTNLKQNIVDLLIKYCQEETVHTIYLITYQELFSYVWQRIIKSQYKSELLKILEEQIMESENKCFTGRFNRTLSVLIGFYDDIKIEISDKSRIYAIILETKDKINPYNVSLHQELATQKLLDAGYTKEEIESWINAIDVN